ncbi:RNA polymerase sigma-70 factor [Gemmatimonas sp.]|uniref:RNA polymerase sigma-70 factor n=1 Tax=Gemmatimonas sp. TaxID=1962908 RepID=UPI003DA3C8C2
MHVSKPSPNSEHATIVGLRSGDLSVFESLFREMHRPLCAFVDRYLRDGARAEEIVQDVFHELWERRDTLDVRGSLRGYLYTAARNRALNARRRRATERAWEEDESHDDVRLLHRPPVAPDRLYDQAETLQRLTVAFETLPERCRETMELRWRHELSYAEVASAMGTGVKAVEKQLARGLRLLRNALLDH